MPEPSQLMFKYQEVLEALIKKADLHEGKWQLILNFGLGVGLGVGFGFGAGNIGPPNSKLSPERLSRSWRLDCKRWPKTPPPLWLPTLQ
jgi:hypothetical protein